MRKGLKEALCVDSAIQRRSEPFGELLEQCEDDDIGIHCFELLSVLGQGAFGKVWLARKKDNEQLYAIKAQDKAFILRQKMLKRVVRERNILEQLDHPFIVRLHFAFQSAESVFLVLNYVPGGTLYTLLAKQVKQRFNEDSVRFYTAEIALALAHLHEHGIAFRDLKPENILLGETGHIMLTDFGLAKCNEDGTGKKNRLHKSLCGTPEFMAPEIITEEGHSHEVDWWSLGVIVYELLAGQTCTPFASNVTKTMFLRILQGQFHEMPGHVSAPARQIVGDLLVVKPHQRLGSAAKGGMQSFKCHAFYSDLKDVCPKQVRPNDDTGSFDWDACALMRMHPPIVPKPQIDLHKVERDLRGFQDFAPFTARRDESNAGLKHEHEHEDKRESSNEEKWGEHSEAKGGSDNDEETATAPRRAEQGRRQGGQDWLCDSDEEAEERKLKIAMQKVPAHLRAYPTLSTQQQWLQVLRRYMRLRSACCVDRAKWEQVAEETIVLTLPDTPYRPQASSWTEGSADAKLIGVEGDGNGIVTAGKCRRFLVGIDALVRDMHAAASAISGSPPKDLKFLPPSQRKSRPRPLHMKASNDILEAALAAIETLTPKSARVAAAAVNAKAQKMNSTQNKPKESPDAKLAIDGQSAGMQHSRPDNAATKPANPSSKGNKSRLRVDTAAQQLVEGVPRLQLAESPCVQLQAAPSSGSSPPSQPSPQWLKRSLIWRLAPSSAMGVGAMFNASGCAFEWELEVDAPPPFNAKIVGMGKAQFSRHPCKRIKSLDLYFDVRGFMHELQRTQERALVNHSS